MSRPRRVKHRPLEDALALIGFAIGVYLILAAIANIA